MNNTIQAKRMVDLHVSDFALSPCPAPKCACSSISLELVCPLQLASDGRMQQIYADHLFQASHEELLPQPVT